MPICEEGDAFILEQCALHLGPAEGEALRQAPVREYDAVAGYVPGFRIDV